MSIAPIASSSASIWPTSGTKRYADAVGDQNLAVLVDDRSIGEALQIIGVLHALRPNDADLGEMAAQTVERRRTLAREQFARPMAHQLGLVVDRAQRDEAH